MIKANQAAARLRRTIKKLGYDPRGEVSVRNYDWSTEILLHSHHWSPEEAAAIEKTMDEIEEANGWCSPFTLNW